MWHAITAYLDSLSALGFVCVYLLVVLALIGGLHGIARLWTWGEPVVFQALDAVTEAWLDLRNRWVCWREQRRRHAVIRRQSRATVAGMAGRGTRGDVSRRRRADVEGRRHQAASITRAQNWAKYTQPDAAARAHAQGVLTPKDAA